MVGTGNSLLSTGQTCPGSGCINEFFDAITTAIVSSLDPNLKEGTSTQSEENYIQGDRRIPYIIYFENADSATAPASEVLILDTIDTSVLDLATLQFEGFNFGTNTFLFDRPITDSCFTREIDLRPDKDAILRIRGQVDHTTGVIQWNYTTYDPATLALTQNIFEGFLPPNVVAPEGEGFVRYSIQPQPNLPHLTTIKNGASIIFDVNEAILTPVWSNGIDKEAPTSQIIALEPRQQDSIFVLNWEGVDLHAGINRYEVYVSENGTDFELFLITSENSTVFTGEVGQTYYFFTRAIDNAGNVEEGSPIAEASTKITTSIEEANLAGFHLYPIIPNPFKESTIIPFEIPEAMEITLEVFNEVGVKQVLMNQQLTSGKHQYTWTANGMSAGIYFLHLKTEKYSLIRKVVLLKPLKFKAK